MQIIKKMKQMKTEDSTSAEINWTWADQISSYRFWGPCLFLVCLIFASNLEIDYSINLLKKINLDPGNFGTLLAIKNLCLLGGIWLAWISVRIRNFQFLHLFSLLIIVGLMLIYFTPSLITLIIFNSLAGISMGAILIVVPVIIFGGRRGREMIFVSFGILMFFETISDRLGGFIYNTIFKSTKKRQKKQAK